MGGDINTMNYATYVRMFELVKEYTTDNIKYSTYSRTVSYRYIHYVGIFLEEHIDNLRVVRFTINQKAYIFEWVLDNRIFTNIIRPGSGDNLDEDEFLIVEKLIDIIINSPKQVGVRYGLK